METQSKVAAAGWAGAATILVVWIAEELGLNVPPEVASAFTTLIAFGAGYAKRPGGSYSTAGGVDPAIIESEPRRKPTRKSR